MGAEGIGTSFRIVCFVNRSCFVFLCLTPRCHDAAARQVLNGIRTEVVVIPYADRTFVVVTQLKKLGNLVSVIPHMLFLLGCSYPLFAKCKPVLAIAPCHRIHDGDSFRGLRLRS